MNTIIHLNALVIKDNKEEITDEESIDLNSKLLAVIEAEGYHMYGKINLTSDKQLQEEGDE